MVSIDGQGDGLSDIDGLRDGLVDDVFVQVNGNGQWQGQGQWQDAKLGLQQLSQESSLAQLADQSSLAGLC